MALLVAQRDRGTVPQSLLRCELGCCSTQTLILKVSVSLFFLLT